MRDRGRRIRLWGNIIVLSLLLSRCLPFLKSIVFMVILSCLTGLFCGMVLERIGEPERACYHILEVFPGVAVTFNLPPVFGRVLIIFAYYISQQFFRGLGQGFLNPMLAAWLPNLVFLTVGLVWIRQLR